MGLKYQRNIGYGLMGFGVALMTGFSLSAYSQVIWFLLIVSLTGIILGFLTMKEAVNLKASNQEIPFKEAVKIAGSFFGLMFLGFLVVVLLGVIRGF